MRKIITVHGEHFDIETFRPKIVNIVAEFDKYLDDYPAKTAKSKHAMMGPVAKILERAQTRNWDVQALTGYAVRVHEMNPKSRGYLSPGSRQALEEGTTQLVALCREVPITAVANVVERIDYGLYYARRKKGIERLEKTRQMFVRFLQDKFNNDFNMLVMVWGKKDTKDINKFDDIRYPSNKNETYKNAGTAKKENIDEFWKQYADQVTNEEEDIND